MRGGIYRACLEIVSRAAESGVCGEAEAWRMTPAELSRRMQAHERALTRRMKDMDMLAWLIGQYCAVAINAPGRYPAQPDRVTERAEGDEEMRRLLRDMSRRAEERRKAE